MNYLVFYIIIILYRIIRYLYFMQMSILQFQIPVNLYKLISFNSRFARLRWVTLVNITFWRRVVEPKTLQVIRVLF